MRSRRRSPWASSRCAGWRRAWRASFLRKASTWRISSSTAAFAANAAQNRRTVPTACSIPTPSRRAICTCCSSRAARGRGKWSCGRGWKNSERSVGLDELSVGNVPLMLLAADRARDADRLRLDAQQRFQLGPDAGVDVAPGVRTQEMELFHWETPRRSPDDNYGPEPGLQYGAHASSQRMRPFVTPAFFRN